MSKTPAVIEEPNQAQVLVTFSGDVTFRASDPERHPDMFNIETPVFFDGSASPSYRFPSGTIILGNTVDLPDRLEAMAKVLTDQAAAIRLARSAVEA